MKTDRVTWLSRLLGVLLILFVSSFALDAFSGEGSWLEHTIGFVIHLLPSFVLLGLLIAAWVKPIVGGWLFVITGIFALLYTASITVLNGTSQVMMGTLIIALLPVIVGASFIFAHYRQKGHQMRR